MYGRFTVMGVTEHNKRKPYNIHAPLVPSPALLIAAVPRGPPIARASAVFAAEGRYIDKSAPIVPTTHESSALLIPELRLC